MQGDKPRENCGLCGVTGGENVIARLHAGLHTLQHRGQEAAGIMVSLNGECRLHKAPGLVEQVFARLPSGWFDEGAAVSQIGRASCRERV